MNGTILDEIEATQGAHTRCNSFNNDPPSAHDLVPYIDFKYKHTFWCRLNS